LTDQDEGIDFPDFENMDLLAENDLKDSKIHENITKSQEMVKFIFN
jgi:hypothetical protein